MDDKKTKMKPEIPQPKPDIVLPGANAADLEPQSVLRMSSPRSDLNREIH